MGREIINKIICSKCGNEFDVATEDIEWEHLDDLGEIDENTNLKDFGVMQTVSCPICNAEQKIVFKAKGENAVHLSEMKVISLEVESA